MPLPRGIPRPGRSRWVRCPRRMAGSPLLGRSYFPLTSTKRAPDLDLRIEHLFDYGEPLLESPQLYLTAVLAIRSQAGSVAHARCGLGRNLQQEGLRRSSKPTEIREE